MDHALVRASSRFRSVTGFLFQANSRTPSLFLSKPEYPSLCEVGLLSAPLAVQLLNQQYFISTPPKVLDVCYGKIWLQDFVSLIDIPWVAERARFGCILRGRGSSTSTTGSVHCGALLGDEAMPLVMTGLKLFPEVYECLGVLA